jgi:phage terminase large subunit-like protein
VTAAAPPDTEPGGRRRVRSSRAGLPAGSPPRWVVGKDLPRGPALWVPEQTLWTPDNTAGIDACDLMQASLRLTKGSRRGELVALRHWQGDLICDILRRTHGGRRMYRTYGVLLARKNSKSLLGAGLALDGLVDEPGAEVYSAAGDKDQAKLVFKEVRDAVEMDPELSKIFKVYRDVIEFPDTGGIYRALSSDSKLKEGLNPSRVLFDELHVQPNDDLYNVLSQGSDTRLDPLLIWLSTMGVAVNRDGTPTLLFREYERLKRLMSGEDEDLTYGGRIYETRLRGRDYRDPSTWYEGNPALGDFLRLEHMETRCRQTPEADFKTKRLNIWVTSRKAWIPDGALDKNRLAGQLVLPGTEAVLTLDGSYNNDSTALTAWLLEPDRKPHLVLLGLWERPRDADSNWHIPIPEVEQLIAYVNGLDEWDGHPIDAAALEDRPGVQQMPRLQVTWNAFDKSRWAHTLTRLEEHDLPVLDFPNSPERMVPATARFYDDLMQQGWTWDGHPAMERHLMNAVTRLTNKGIMIDKRGSRAKIDAAVSALIGYAVVQQPGETTSTYEDNELLVLG